MIAFAFLSDLLTLLRSICLQSLCFFHWSLIYPELFFLSIWDHIFSCFFKSLPPFLSSIHLIYRRTHIMYVYTDVYVFAYILSYIHFLYIYLHFLLHIKLLRLFLFDKQVLSLDPRVYFHNSSSWHLWLPNHSWFSGSTEMTLE